MPSFLAVPDFLTCFIHWADSTTASCNLVCSQAHFRCCGSPTHHSHPCRCCLHFLWLIRRGVCWHSEATSLNWCSRKRHLASKHIAALHRYSNLDCWCFLRLFRTRCKPFSWLGSVMAECSLLDSYVAQVIWRRKPASVAGLSCPGSHWTRFDEDLCSIVKRRLTNFSHECCCCQMLQFNCLVEYRWAAFSWWLQVWALALCWFQMMEYSLPLGMALLGYFRL